MINIPKIYFKPTRKMALLFNSKIIIEKSWDLSRVKIKLVIDLQETNEPGRCDINIKKVNEFRV